VVCLESPVIRASSAREIGPCRRAASSTDRNEDWRRIDGG
jgi:hypothetical protein